MRKINLIASLVFVTFVLTITGCTEIEDYIEKQTESTFVVSQSVHNSTDERNISYAGVVDEVIVAGGEVKFGGVASVDALADSFAIAEAGMGDVRFFVTGYLRNQTDKPAYLTLQLLPNANADIEPITIGRVTLAPHQEHEMTIPGQMDQTEDEIDANLRAVLSELDDNYFLDSILQVQGADTTGVLVQDLQIAALPVYWKDEAFDSSLKKYRKSIENVSKATLEGSVTNYGTEAAEVSIYFSVDGELDPETNLVAHAYLAPNETISGYEMLTANGSTQIKDAFENMIKGKEVIHDYVVVSRQPLMVRCSNLRIQAELTVRADIF